ncbi:hypothetical protein HYY69_03595 [Candidatus Woesearchaeota archaeon]|nr:hypothetical protein [Candidatus Woesearchaeota archaeon]
MYKITTRSKKAEKQFYYVLNLREGIKEKIKLLQEDPRRNSGAHKLKGHLDGKWSAILGGDIRLEIDDIYQEIIIYAAGSHKIY